MITEIHLKKGHDKRALAGHPWIFAGETDRIPKGAVQPGDLADVFTASGQFLGRGLVNPHSQILVRVVDSQRFELDETFFKSRIKAAAAYRKKIGYEPECLRLISSEADGLPGLIVDRYNDYLVIQALTAGMYRRLDIIKDALIEVIQPKGIFLKNDSPFLEREGLDQEKKVLWGEWPEPLEVTLDDLRLQMDMERAQKTGLFLDQTLNRRMLAGFTRNKAVLDICCYLGLWSLQAAKGGASRVLGIDASAEAVERARTNAEINGFSNQCQFERQTAFDALEQLAEKGERFDVIVLDPPAFVKTKTKIKSAVKGYEKLNRLALRILNKPGLLVTCSCSYQLFPEVFQQMIQDSLRKESSRGKMLYSLSQSPDHPVLLTMPETRYLKCAYVFVE